MNKKIKNFEQKVRKTIKKYNLLNKKDKILVAASGGKDSTTVLYLLNKFNFKPKAITIDLGIGGYSKENLKNITYFCKKHNIKLHTASFKKEFGHSLCYIRSILKSKGIKLSSCAVCGVLKRYLINKKARQLKATKLVTGHNLDDEAQSILMNLLRNDTASLSRLGPITGIIKEKKFIPRIKPLYFCSEKEIINYSKLMKFPVNYKACPCSTEVYRRFILNLLNKYSKKNPKLKENIINWFLAALPNLKKQIKDKKISYCKKCKEPSKGNICMTCQIIDKLKS